MGGQHARAIAVVREQPGFDDRAGAARVAFGNARGAVFGVVGVGVDNSILDAAGHIAVGVVLIGIR